MAPIMTTPTLALITVLATLAYLGLAILGWEGCAAFFSHPPLCKRRSKNPSLKRPVGPVAPE